MERGAPSQCTVCQDLDVFNSVIPAKSLFRSAESGCSGCDLLREGIYQFTESLDPVDHVELLVDCSLHVAVLDNKKRRLTRIEFYTHPGHPTVWRKVGPARDVSLNSSSDECIALAKRWLEGCLKAHAACKRLSTPPLPTRVIDVGSSDSAPFLHISEGECAEYAALSHCWGGSNPLTTTVSTFKERKEFIQFNESCKTFEDAVNVTRRLGLRYLWIDSLCIIQDSADDWGKEAGSMSSVYNNATIVLSSDSSANSSQGLFPRIEDRQPLNRILTIPCKGVNGQPENVYVRKRHGDPFSTKNNVHSGEELKESFLVTRGWILQEELLSPRILRFRKEELSWICSTCSRCECRIRPAPPPPSSFRKDRVTKPESLEELILDWPVIVMDFTRHKLKRSCDRLPAVSGLAGWVEKQTHDIYVCGLWYKDLKFLLLWYNGGRQDDKPVGAGELSFRFPHPYAPSWSWASISGPINYYSRFTDQFTHTNQRSAYMQGPAIKPLLNVVNAWAVPQGANKYGPVQMAMVQLHAMILPVRFDRARSHWIPEVNINGLDPRDLCVHIDVPTEFPGAEEGLSYEFLLAGKLVYLPGTIVNREAACLLVRRMTTLEDRRRLMSAVMTFHTLATVKNSYVRVGFVEGAGSIDAWKASAPKRYVNVF